MTNLVLDEGQGQLQRFENVGGADDAMITGPYWIFTAADRYSGTLNSPTPSKMMYHQRCQ
ncbi:hypothetical protein O9993_18080 [Vibrio lentus]|nr:hypothetical protein [Vibrio lentus]